MCYRVRLAHVATSGNGEVCIVAKKKHIGPCHLCGENGELSEEHVPPKRAYNSGTVIVLKKDDAMWLDPGEWPKHGRKQEGGARAFTLCHRCNNNTGSWYAAEFVTFARRAAEVIRHSRGAPVLAHPIRCRPLRVLKQIATMFFSVNEPTFREQNPELVAFVLNKRRAGLSSKYGFFIYLNVEGQTRHWGMSAKVDTSGWNLIHGPLSMRPNVYCSEITFPPLGYVMTIDSPPPDPRLVPIHHFATFDFERQADLHARLPLLQTHSHFPGDYATLSDLARRREENRRDERRLPPSER